MCLLLPDLRAEDAKKVIAVVEFKVTGEDKSVSGWSVAENLENAIFARQRYRIVNRSAISKVITELKFQSSELVDDAQKAGKVGQMLGANLLVTGEIIVVGNSVSISAKLIDASDSLGEVKLTAEASGEYPGNLEGLYSLLAYELTLSPEEFCEYGMLKLREKDYQRALTFLKKAAGIKSDSEIVSAIAQAEKGAEAQRILLSRRDAYRAAMSKGWEMIKAKKWNAAEDCFKKAMAVHGYEEDKDAKAGLASAADGAGLRSKEASSEKAYRDAIAKASTAFDKAKKLSSDPKNHPEAVRFSSEAISTLEDFSREYRQFLPQDKLSSLNEFIASVELFRKAFYSGPEIGREWTVPDIGMKFQFINKGAFLMGNPASSTEQNAEDKAHISKITRDFWMGRYEVTIGEFVFFLKDSASDEVNRGIDWNDKDCPLEKGPAMKGGKAKFWGDPAMPMIEISWEAANLFCKWLTEREKKEKRLPKGYAYRLPTEAEWEYACRAGTKEDFYFPKGEEIERHACFKGNSGGQTRPVSETTPNPWRLHGMYGNVWEWCLDSYAPYIEADVEDPICTEKNEDDTKVARGGSFQSGSEHIRSNSRAAFYFKSTEESIGFRVVIAPEL
ncbi:MAG TPA: SUMF1/EgtB/PvdO family nonheme iron enzyme [Victivallales bacterium]|nr:SUMF1/EgtB/PvdO family nonheme iron enzyme [Victivallales bacterium]